MKNKPSNLYEKSRNIRIAILGSRGIPARYGGFDTFAEELSIRLANFKNFEVFVYCRKNYFENYEKNYCGVRLFYLPAPRFKAFESLLHSFLSSIHVMRQCIDIVYFLDPANAPFCVLLRLLGKSIVVHTNGLGWKRKKWGKLARSYYKFVEWVCSRTAQTLVTDNPSMKEYYQINYNVNSFYTSYGASNKYGLDETVYKELEIVPKGYNLIVARLEPENNTDILIKEYVKSKVTTPLIVVGDSPYSKYYFKKLEKLSNNNKRIFFVGRYNNQAKLNALYKGAFLYIHGHEVGGTNPSLLRAMDAAAAPLVINVSFNRHVIADCGFLFNREGKTLSEMLRILEKNPDLVIKIGVKAKKRTQKKFRWKFVVKEHAYLFSQIANK